MTELIAMLEKMPGLVPAITKIVEAFLKHEDPVAEAERQATIAAAKVAIRLPFQEKP